VEQNAYEVKKNCICSSCSQSPVVRELVSHFVTSTVKIIKQEAKLPLG